MNKNVSTRVLLASLILSLLAIGAAGCSTQLPAGSVQAAQLAQSDRERQPGGMLDETQLTELVTGNTEFALTLQQQSFDWRENQLLAPHSLSTAIAMVYAGARGETERQLAQALHFTLPQVELHAAFNALDQALAGRETKEDTFQLQVINAAWGQQETRFAGSFLDTLAENYGAGIRLLDFEQSEQALRTINAWGSEQTEQRIPALLPDNSVGSETVLVLTNATYFKAGWQHPFAAAATRDAAFTLLDDSQRTVPMMTQVASLRYAAGRDVQLVELPYAGGDVSMVILLPDGGAFEAFGRELDARTLAGLLGELQPVELRLTMPRFSYSANLELKDPLMALGMRDAFGGEADLSGIDGTGELFIDQVYQQTFISVDEAGSEAAGASAVVIARKGESTAELELAIDHPFLFLIRDNQTGAILFLGQVTNPAA